MRKVFCHELSEFVFLFTLFLASIIVFIDQKNKTNKKHTLTHNVFRQTDSSLSLPLWYLFPNAIKNIDGTIVFVAAFWLLH